MIIVIEDDFNARIGNEIIPGVKQLFNKNSNEHVIND